MTETAGRERYFLQVMMDIDPEYEGAFNSWYDEEHFPERMATPGFLWGRRLRVTPELGAPPSTTAQQAPRYMAIYEIESLSVLTSEAYQTLQVDSERTKSIIPGVSNVFRTVYVDITPEIPAGYLTQAVRP